MEWRRSNRHCQLVKFYRPFLFFVSWWLGMLIRSLHCFTSLAMVMWVYVSHCSEGTTLIPR